MIHIVCMLFNPVYPHLKMKIFICHRSDQLQQHEPMWLLCSLFLNSLVELQTCMANRNDTHWKSIKKKTEKKRKKERKFSETSSLDTNLNSKHNLWNAGIRIFNIHNLPWGPSFSNLETRIMTHNVYWKNDNNFHITFKVSITQKLHGNNKAYD